MMIYVTSAQGGREAFEAAHALQRRDLDNCYVFFCSLLHGEVEEAEETELRLDLVTACDAIMVAGDIGGIVAREVELARVLGMEVMRVEDGQLRPLPQ